MLGEKHPELCSFLFQHLENVLEAYNNFSGMGWFNDDKLFRQKLSVHSSLKWGMKYVGLWLNLMLCSKDPPAKQSVASPVNSPYRKGKYFAYNESQCKWSKACKYKHECSHCSGTTLWQGVSKEPAVLGQCNRIFFKKSIYSSDISKYATVIGQVSKQGDSVLPH